MDASQNRVQAVVVWGSECRVQVHTLLYRLASCASSPPLLVSPIALAVTS